MSTRKLSKVEFKVAIDECTTVRIWMTQFKLWAPIDREVAYMWWQMMKNRDIVEAEVCNEWLLIGPFPKEYQE